MHGRNSRCEQRRESKEQKDDLSQRKGIGPREARGSRVERLLSVVRRYCSRERLTTKKA